MPSLDSPGASFRPLPRASPRTGDRDNDVPVTAVSSSGGSAWDDASVSRRLSEPLLPEPLASALTPEGTLAGLETGAPAGAGDAQRSLAAATAASAASAQETRQEGNRLLERLLRRDDHRGAGTGSGGSSASSAASSSVAVPAPAAADGVSPHGAGLDGSGLGDAAVGAAFAATAPSDDRSAVPRHADAEEDARWSLAKFSGDVRAAVGGDFDPASLRWKLADALGELADTRGLLTLQATQLAGLKDAVRELQANARRMETLGALPPPPTPASGFKASRSGGHGEPSANADDSHDAPAVIAIGGADDSIGTPARPRLSSDVVGPSPAPRPGAGSFSAPSPAHSVSGSVSGSASASGPSASVQMQYLANSLLAYMTAHTDAERARMLPAIGVLLSLSQEQLDRVRSRLRVRGPGGASGGGAVPVPGLGPGGEGGQLSSLWGLLRRQ